MIYLSTLKQSRTESLRPSSTSYNHFRHTIKMLRSPMHLYRSQCTYHCLLAFSVIAITISQLTLASGQVIANRTIENHRNAIRRDVESQNSAGNDDGDGQLNGCNSCRLRKQMQDQSLASFKKHLLRRLEMAHPPNITAKTIPHVAENVIQNFYHKYGYRYIRKNGNSNSPGDRMYGDDPNGYNGRLDMDGDNDELYDGDGDADGYMEENEDDEFFSITNSIYSFPTLSKARHRGDVLEFDIKGNYHLSYYQAIFHLHIRGEDWIKENEPLAASSQQRSDISISLNRMLRGAMQRYTRTDSDYVGAIPKGQGATIKFNVTDMVLNWIGSENAVQEVVIKTLEPWMRSLLVLDSNAENGPYIEIFTRDTRKKRAKRHLSLNCKESDKEARCCRYPFRVDFRGFEWDWVIAPDVYEAFYCSGECSTGYLPKNPHSYILQLSSSFSPCCSPRKLSSLNLLYFDDNRQVIHSIIPNMAVEKCSCS